jgi:ketosteroid isomerase-like protein
MKRTLIVAVLTIAVTSLALGQMKSKSGRQSASLQQTLMQVEQELVDALVRGDVAPWERYLADTYIFTAPDGTTQNKAQFIEELKSGALKMESSKNADMKVQVYGDTAVVTYRSTDKGTDKGTDISGHYRWTDVFVKRNGRWQIVSTQGTSIAKP